MTSQVLWVAIALSSILFVTSFEAFKCPQICHCTASSFQCSNDTQKDSESYTTSIVIKHLDLQEIPTHAFKQLINIKVIQIYYSTATQIQTHAFLSIHGLREITIKHMKNLRTIEKGAFTDLPNLTLLCIFGTGLMHFPDLSTISSLEFPFRLKIQANMAVKNIPANSFNGMTKKRSDISLMGSSFKEINPHAFNGTFIGTLDLSHNKHLRNLPDDAFEGAVGPLYLDVSSTALTSLPRKGLERVKRLRAKSAFALKRLPPLDSLVELGEAELTYESQCCAFHMWHSKHRQQALKNPQSVCELLYTNAGGATELYKNFPELEHICPSNDGIQCTPKPDDFNPCEDLLGPILGNMTWIIAFFTIVANLTVLVILLFTSRKLTISRFLICNLALADLCMGFYLMLIARMDYHSRHEYYNHATEWQTGPGCDMSGFLTMFSSELSVYTLTVISFERWYTIINAIDLNKRLSMHHVVAIMVVGWVFSLLVALLPLVGVSSYGKVSICLPMDIDTQASQAYVMIVLSLNVAAFLGVCFCYVCMYQSVRKPLPANHYNDAKLAKRMAVLIFTDFLCIAPISFFAISATLHMPLITVSHSKILLTIFYPINSLCNPFLYTIFTRGFRKEVRFLLRHWGSPVRAFIGKCLQLHSYLIPNNAQHETTL
ncbi:lutropin-choriogonadotropic hormone receptor-like [Corythoichthys intestinalis]|uniref:lutropin-choriogonadotropic hormone receptor-like n=1 Tax=Corythoichthys intestinalis TaxID=161448 RepID=UPI0025A59A4D|nr:lutropin-choriogonadotropic hormone receptor-like [Corythoichthys intestinalis]XP_061793865.1 lutropin-choriogonadotropic hormone receptor-like [Nerophis lumbriciformis]